MGDIPTINVSALIHDKDAAARQAAAKQLADCVAVRGYAAITGHGLLEADLRDAFAAMRRLFDLPLEDKMRAPHPDGPYPHRGYLATSIEKSGKLGIIHSNSESEKAFFANAVDWKETYDIGHEENDGQKNIWLPDECFPGFKSYMINLYDRLTTISLAILEGLMQGMNLTEKDRETLRQMHSPTEHQMRLAHYLPMTPEDLHDPNKIRLAAHRDFSSYTLLFQESRSGLEFQDPSTGKYIPAVPREGVLYLNIGNLMERFSNGFYPAAMHRVAIDTTQSAQGSIPGRFSIPYFSLVSPADSIYPMPSRVEIDGKARYEHITYQDLVAKLFNPVIQKKEIAASS